MFNRDQLQARKSLGYYPAIPAMWPNRATLRAVRQGRNDRLSGEWRHLLAVTPNLRTAIRAL